MLKKRIIPVQLLRNGRLVKTTRFDTYRDVGDPVASSRVYNAALADELVFLNINRDASSIEPLLPLLEAVSEVCFMPLSLGGGVRSFRDAELLLRHGADKVVVNSALYENPGLIEQIAGVFGAQAVVASVDARRSEGAPGGYELLRDCGRVRVEHTTLVEHVRAVCARGAGEVLVNSVDRDGTMTGYDIALLRQTVEAAGQTPVIGCGGAGHYEHLLEGFVQGGVQALACGSLFNFGDSNPIRAKAFLSNHGLAFKVV